MKNIFSNRRRTREDIIQQNPALIGATDREIEKLARDRRQSNDIRWQLNAAQHGFRG